MAADRYLAVVRYLDTLNEDERRSMLHDSATTIQALLTTIHLKARGGLWTDPLERPTAAGLLNVLVPVTDIKVRSCYAYAALDALAVRRSRPALRG